MSDHTWRVREESMTEKVIPKDGKRSVRSSQAASVLAPVVIDQRERITKNELCYLLRLEKAVRKSQFDSAHFVQPLHLLGSPSIRGKRANAGIPVPQTGFHKGPHPYGTFTCRDVDSLCREIETCAPLW